MPFPISLEKIAETEVAMGVTFPASYKVHMSRDNGGVLDLGDEDVWYLHPFFDTTNRKTLSRTCGDIRRETEELRNFPGFPGDGVVIAHDGSGGHLLLRATNGEVGDAVWVFRIQGGTLAKLVDDVAELWERDAGVEAELDDEA